MTVPAQRVAAWEKPTWFRFVEVVRTGGARSRAHHCCAQVSDDVVRVLLALRGGRGKVKVAQGKRKESDYSKCNITFKIRVILIDASIISSCTTPIPKS